MDLVVAGLGDLQLTPTQERLGNIRVGRMTTGPQSDGLVINARVATDEDNRTSINSRAPGRIEKLYVRETGRPIVAGEPLYDLYSESLIAQVQEYMMLKDQHARLGGQRDHYASLLKGAEKKLIRYGLTAAQITKLTRATSRVTFLAPSSGTVSELMVAEGQYVEAGTPMYRLDDLHKLWLEAELYPHEVEGYKIGDVISVHIAGDAKILEAKVSFLTPAYSEAKQTLILRASLANPEGSILPGMQATIQRNDGNRMIPQLPLEAVIRDGKGACVFVRTGERSYSRRAVKTGSENSTHVEITDGVLADDDVVVSGAYLLYSEHTLKTGSGGAE